MQIGYNSTLDSPWGVPAPWKSDADPGGAKRGTPGKSSISGGVRTCPRNMMNFPPSQHKGIGPPLQCQETRPTLSGNGVGLNTADFDRFGRFSVPPIRAAVAGYLLGTETKGNLGHVCYPPQKSMISQGAGRGAAFGPPPPPKKIFLLCTPSNNTNGVE